MFRYVFFSSLCHIHRLSGYFFFIRKRQAFLKFLGISQRENDLLSGVTGQDRTGNCTHTISLTEPGRAKDKGTLQRVVREDPGFTGFNGPLHRYIHIYRQHNHNVNMYGSGWKAACLCVCVRACVLVCVCAPHSGQVYKLSDVDSDTD